MYPAARALGLLASNFPAGILTDLKGKLCRQRAKDLPIGHIDSFQTSPKGDARICGI